MSGVVVISPNSDLGRVILDNPECTQCKVETQGSVSFIRVPRSMAEVLCKRAAISIEPHPQAALINGSAYAV